jgi:hypothetical protein
MAYKSQPTVTRPANTTPYTGGDVVGGAFQLTGILGQLVIRILSAGLRIDVSAIPAGMTSFRLHLYSATPPSALADNAPWDLPSGDRASYQGYVDIGSPVDLGSTLYVSSDQLKDAQPGTTGLWGYLVTNGGFTPAANSEVYTPELYAIAL